MYKSKLIILNYNVLQQWIHPLLTSVILFCPNIIYFFLKSLRSVLDHGLKPTCKLCLHLQRAVFTHLGLWRSNVSVSSCCFFSICNINAWCVTNTERAHDSLISNSYLHHPKKVNNNRDEGSASMSDPMEVGGISCQEVDGWIDGFMCCVCRSAAALQLLLPGLPHSISCVTHDSMLEWNYPPSQRWHL